MFKLRLFICVILSIYLSIPSLDEFNMPTVEVEVNNRILKLQISLSNMHSNSYDIAPLNVKFLFY